MRKALQAGALGYVIKSGATEELLTAIEEVWKGNVYISPGLGESVIWEARNPRAGSALSPFDLTDRQRHILQLVAEGRSSKEIAAISQISIKTVDFHRGRIMTKLGARSIAELTRFAIAEGLVDGGED